MPEDPVHVVWAILLGGVAYLFATAGAGGFGITIAAVLGFLAVVQLGMAWDRPSSR